MQIKEEIQQNQCEIQQKNIKNMLPRINNKTNIGKKTKTNTQNQKRALVFSSHFSVADEQLNTII